MKAFVRCEICCRKCKHRGETNNVTGAKVDGCIVSEEKINDYTKGN